MREITFNEISNAVKELCIKANRILPSDIADKIKCASEKEDSPLAKSILNNLLLNMDAAQKDEIAICQDTGMAVVFAQIGQEVHITGGLFEEAVNDGVKRGYTEGYLRLSVVGDPLGRINTGDNTPAVIHTEIIAGDEIKITVAPKGFGSENMSALKMFTPAATEQDIVDFVSKTVKNAGGNPCPPVIIGVGIGSNFEGCALLAKKALCRSTDIRNGDERYAALEDKMLKAVNMLGIGPQGFGGRTTALAVNIEYGPTHIAGLPVAVNMGCHVTRHATKVI